MSVSEDIIRLVLETKGQETIDKLQKSTNNYKALLGELVKSYDKGEVATDEFLKTSEKYANQLEQETDLLQQLTAAQDAQAKSLGKVDAAAKKAKSSTSGLSQSALQFGRALQDFQAGGFLGVSNNLEGIAQALGLGAGVAGAVTALGAAYLAFKPQIEEFLKGFQTKPIEEFQGAIERLEGRIKEIEAKPFKLTADVRELERAQTQIKELKSGLAAFDAAMASRSSDEVNAGKDFAVQFAETGPEGRAALEAVRKRVSDAYVDRDPGVRAAQRALFERERTQKETARAQAEAEQKAAAAAATPGVTQAMLDSLNQEVEQYRKDAREAANPDDIAKLRANLDKATTSARERGRSEVGTTFDKVTQGDDEMARDVMAARFREAGFEKFARMAEGASPQAIAAKRIADQQAAMAASHATPEEAEQAKKAAEDRRKLTEKQQQAMEAQFGSVEDAARHQKALDDERKAAQRIQAESNRHQVEQQIAREDASLSAGGYDVGATGLLAQATLAGGAQDRFGRFQPMNAEMIREYVAGEVAAELMRRNKGMNPRQAEDLGTKTSLEAQADVGNQLAAMQQQGQGQVQALQNIVLRQQGLFNRIMQQSAQIDGTNRRLERGLAELYNKPAGFNGNPWGGP